MDNIHGRQACANAMRRKYWVRLGFRGVAGVLSMGLYFLLPAEFALLEGMFFFGRLSILHLFWLIWMADMLCKLRPARAVLALGAQKQFGRYHVPANQAVENTVVKDFVRESNRGARRVFIVWGLLIAAIGVVKRTGWIGREVIFLLVVFFYICDLICVLVWCPFRVFLMKNKCCTTCRIFNWDHLMMFTPFLYVKGFYGWSLLGMAVLVFLVWEITFKLHPERFWEKTNRALRCGECTDRLCGK